MAHVPIRRISNKILKPVEIDFTWSLGFVSVEPEAQISLMMFEFSSCLLADSAMNLASDSSIVSPRAGYEEFPLLRWPSDARPKVDRVLSRWIKFHEGLGLSKSSILERIVLVQGFREVRNWNGLSKVPVMKYMIQSKAVLNFKSAEMIRPASDTPYCVKRIRLVHVQLILPYLYFCSLSEARSGIPSRILTRKVAKSTFVGARHTRSPRGHLTRVDFFTREIQKFCTQHHDAQKEHGSCEKLRYDVLREVAWLTSKRVWETRKAWLGLRLHCMALEHRVTVLEIESVKFYGLLPASSRQGSEPRPAPKQLATHYSEFLKCKPLDFKGTEGVVGLTRWFEKMESVFSISNCTAASQVKFATCTLQDDALTWWNAHVKTTTPEAAHAMPWAALKKMMTDKYCPRGEIKKIETEMWNLKVKGTDVVAYSRRFQQLALMCSRMFPEEIDKIEKYIGGLPDMIHGSVKASKPKTMQEAIEFTTELMDEKTHAYAERQAERKRKYDDLSKNNQNQQNKRQNTGQAYTAGNSDRKPYAGVLKKLCCSKTHTLQSSKVLATPSAVTARGLVQWRPRNYRIPASTTNKNNQLATDAINAELKDILKETTQD
ncbi:reverse transcriptase domain-containing protein [Tanacetum coccineum]|uniref:Reverse transcriptase domain-containing protein n=1 Tax=Tanacetum coccineum TaxID=301880 RepID=A0ABQ4XRU8_9ASTR